MCLPRCRMLASLLLLTSAFECLQAAQPPGPAVALWSFDGNLADCSGSGNHASGITPAFTEGHIGQGLRTGTGTVVVPDRADLRLAPGLRIDCRVKLAKLPTGYDPIVIKVGEYQLRVDPPHEGGHFTFFTHLDGRWDPRVRSKEPAATGTWYHLVAKWDGTFLSLEVNGDRTTLPRSGQRQPTGEPLRIGAVDGIIDELQIENPGANRSAVGLWTFDTGLHDSSGHGHDMLGDGAQFAPGRTDQALQCGAEQILAPNNPDLNLSPGLRIDASVRLEQDLINGGIIVFKDGEYQLRVNPRQEGAQFAFFVNLDGQWEPRVCSREPAKPGAWHRLIAKWDGLTLTLDVNGTETKTGHSGSPNPTSNPLRIGAPGLMIDDLRIENPKLPILRVSNLVQQHAIPRLGRSETIKVVLCSLGSEAARVRAELELPEGVNCTEGNVRRLGTMPMGTTRTVSWTLLANAAIRGRVGVRLSADGCPPATTHYPLAFLPSESEPPIFRVAGDATPDMGRPGATTYFVDSQAGRNTHSGTSPDTPWRDFTNINGKTLAAGQRLLIKRGSVINQQLEISAQGTEENWAEIGVYGAGPRPMIRRNWDIADRCVLVRDPDYLRIRSLVVCHAAKGLVVTYKNRGHRGLIIEDCIAHHIEGLYRPNSSGIPEWYGRSGPAGDAFDASAGIAITGAHAQDLLVRDCEMFQTSWGFFIVGDNVTIDRVYCHDNYCYNTSPHPALVNTRQSSLQNSIFDRSGWHAHAGTMGIMLVGQDDLVIRNCTFRNQPDSGSHDEGGIDFENSGNGCLIDNCTFENNAGAAIEVLGLQTPQARNLEIRHSRFIRNNAADKLGPAEIYVWGKQPNPDVCCSSGIVYSNAYVTLPGVEFFVNEAPTTTYWVLHDNTRYATVEELAHATRFNRPPVVRAGPDICTASRAVRLSGSVSDDGQPDMDRLATRWEVLEGPGPVTFRNGTAPDTTADFSRPGDYLLRLVGDDGELWLSATVAVHILPHGTAAARSWEFNSPLDKEGWTEVNPGTRVRTVGSEQWPCISHPVKYVAGGYYVLAIENSTDACMLSPDELEIDLEDVNTIAIRVQNHTPATVMRFRFTTDSDSTWNDAKSRDFAVAANDNVPRAYVVDMSTLPAWTGRLRQLRLDVATGELLTGTCRLDYVRLDRVLETP